MLRMSDTQVLQSIGLDRFMVLRFLRMGIVVFVLFTFLAVPILIPLNVINQLDSKGLNLLTIGNVKDLNRLWAHWVLALILTGKKAYMHKATLYLLKQLIFLYLCSRDHLLHFPRNSGVSCVTSTLLTWL